MKIEIHVNFALTDEQREWDTKMMEAYANEGDWCQWDDKLWESGVSVPLKGVEDGVAHAYLSRRKK